MREFSGNFTIFPKIDLKITLKEIVKAKEITTISMTKVENSFDQRIEMMLIEECQF